MKKKNRHPSVDPSEWDFSDCPQAELPECFFYELARESENFKAWHEGWVAWLDSEKKGGCIPLGTWGVRYSLRSSWRDFPNTPWLEILAPQRELVFHKVTFDQPGFQRAMGDSGSAEWLEYETGDEVAKFVISWACPDSKIKADFAAWIKQHRPPEKAINPGALWQNTRGQTPHWSSMLKALGAHRLMSRHTALEAEAVTSRHFRTKFPSNDKTWGPLFSSESSWADARREAVGRIHEIDTAFKDPFQPI